MGRKKTLFKQNVAFEVGSLGLITNQTKQIVELKYLNLFSKIGVAANCLVLSL